MKTKSQENTRKDLCPVFQTCGGCQLLGMPYEQQLRQKQRQVEQQLKGICRVEKIVGMQDPLHYRSKVNATFDYQRGRVVSGIYQEGTHQVVPVERCLIEDEKADEILSTIRSLLASFKIKTYNEDSGYGLLRHVLIRRAFATGQVMVVLVTASPVFPSKNNFIRALRERHPEITTVVQNQNDRGTSMVLGEKEKVLYGKGYIEDVLCGCTFRISSRSFCQVNPVQAERLYDRAIRAANLTGKETVIDAYCGVGTIGILAAAKAGRVIGAERNGDAVRDAVQNARRNHASNVTFYHGDAGRFMEESDERADVVFLDPPRSGSTEPFIRAVAGHAPARVVYVSCSPETLARDLRLFQKYGYRAEQAWPYDMFPFTSHIETVCALSGSDRKRYGRITRPQDGGLP